MSLLSTPLVATGWQQTLVNDADGNTILLMPNAHKSLEAVQEATALFAAAPELLAVLVRLVNLRGVGIADDTDTPWPDARAAIEKARQRPKSTPFAIGQRVHVRGFVQADDYDNMYLPCDTGTICAIEGSGLCQIIVKLDKPHKRLGDQWAFACADVTIIGEA